MPEGIIPVCMCGCVKDKTKIKKEIRIRKDDCGPLAQEERDIAVKKRGNKFTKKIMKGDREQK